MRIKLRVLQKIVSVLSSTLLLVNAFSPYLLIAPSFINQVKAQDVTAEPTVIPTQDVTPTTEITPEPTVEPTVEVTPEVTPTPVITTEVTPEVTPVVTETPVQSVQDSTPTPNPLEVTNSPSPPSPTPTTEVLSTPLINGVVETVLVESYTCRADSLNGCLITDKPDYAPTDMAVITGHSFAPTTIYILRVASSDAPAVDSSYQITTDANGSFTYSYQLDGNYRPNYLVELKDSFGFVVASVTFTDSDPENVSTLAQLITALADTSIITINITADISGITEELIVGHAVTINGGSHTLTFTSALNALADGHRDGIFVMANGTTINDLSVVMAGTPNHWDGVYGIQFYGVTGGVVNNYTGTGADAALLVNGSAVTLTGSINVSGNEFGGIESSRTNAVLNVSGVSWTNSSEVYGLPTIWEDGVTGTTVINYGVFTRITKGGQYQYYLTAGNSVDPATAKAITAFNFASPAATGVVDEGAKTIAVTVPNGTDVTALVPTITLSAGASVSPTSGTPNNFSTPQTYTVTAADATLQGYTVTVTVAPDTTPPTVTSVSSIINGATVHAIGTSLKFNSATAPNPHTITVTFSEDISTTPTIAVSGDAQTVNNCPDADAKTFCFAYAIPAATEYTTKTIQISGAQDVALNTMAANNSHPFIVDTVTPLITISGLLLGNILPTINIANASSYTLNGTYTELGSMGWFAWYTFKVLPSTLLVAIGSVATESTTTIGTSLPWSHTWTNFSTDLAGLEGTFRIWSDVNDTANNRGYLSNDGTYDLVAPTTPVINTVATDDIINATERTATVTVTGTNESGSTVTLNGFATTVVSPTTWSYVLNAAAIDAFLQGTETLTAIATDTAGNPSAVNGTRGITVDTVAPSVTLTSPTANPTNGMVFVVAQFSETVTGFVQGDFVFSGGAVNGFVASDGDTYNFSVNPTDGPSVAVTIDVPAAASTDAAGNANTASNQITRTSDTVAPSAFTVGLVTTSGGTLSPGYWNSTNTGGDVVVPIANDSSLVGGTVQLQAEADGTYQTVRAPSTITLGMLDTTHLMFGFNAAELEGIAGFVDGATVHFNAIITDLAGNPTTGTQSATALTVDQSAPAVLTVVKIGDFQGVDLELFTDTHPTFEFSVTGIGETVFSDGVDLDIDIDPGEETDTSAPIYLAAGSYDVLETLRSGWQLSDVECIYDGESVGVAVEDGERITVDSGDEVTCTFTNTTRSIVSGMKWNDINNNGDSETGESGIAGWSISLFNADFDGEIFTATTLVTTTTTNGDGNYSFSNLDPDLDYVVCEETQSGWEQTSPIIASTANETANCENGTVGYIAINNGAGTPRTFTNKNFGNYNTPVSLSGGGGGGGTVAGTSTSNPSAPVCNDTKPGSAPVLLSAVAGFNSVTLTWAKASDPVSYYLVTFGTSSGAQTYGNPNIGDKDTTSYTVSGLSGGTTYYFKVRAGNGCMPGDFSNEVSAAPTGGFVEGVPAGFEAGVLGEATKSGELVGGELTGEPTPTTTVINAGLVKGIESIAKNKFSKYIFPVILLILLILLILYFYKKRKK